MSKIKKEEIRLNRDRIRKSLKGCLITPSTSSHGEKLVNVKELDTIQENKKKLKRKASLEVRVGSPISILNDVYIENSFDELFVKVRKISQGSQSVVYECIQKDTNQHYAVKMIRNKDAETFKKLKEQYRILKNLSHPNIIKAHYLFINEKQGTSHMVCELCEYQDLRTYFLKNRKLKEAKAAQIIKLLLNALTYLHKKGVCHRDLKPQNILYDETKSDMKIIDFQISKMVQYDHQKLDMWTNTGTLHYMAPEMWKGGYNELIDIWAVGVMCYEMVIGRMPFDHLYQKEVIKKIMEEQANYDLPTITPSCIDFIKSCLQKNPIKRISAEEAKKHPFMLKYSSKSNSNSSPRMRKNSSQIWKKGFPIQLIKCSRDDDSIQCLNDEFLTSDVGIRLVVDL